MPSRSSTRAVLQAVQDLHAQEQIVTRETLAEFTGLKLAIVDDRLKSLIEDLMVIRVGKGVFVPADQHPPARPMSKTLLPDGTVNIEIGDHVLILTPKEDRMLASLQAGAAMQTSSIELGHQAAQANGELNARMNRLERLLVRMGEGK
jgi:hypothetical protein